VARNKVTNLYRKQKTISLDDGLHSENNDGIPLKEILLLNDSDPCMQLFKEAFWNELMEALDELPANQREAFVLNELEDLSLQQIADQTGKNIKTIISRKGYAMKHLKKRLAYLYQEINL